MTNEERSTEENETPEEQDQDRIIRMVKTAGGPMGCFRAEALYVVPGEVGLELAEAWVKAGAAVWAEGVTVDQIGPRSGGPTRKDMGRT